MKQETKFSSSRNISRFKYLVHKRIFVLCWPLGGLDILTNRFWRRPVWNSNPNWAGSNWKSTSMVSFSLQAHRPPLLEGMGVVLEGRRAPYFYGTSTPGWWRGLLIRRSSRYQLTFCVLSVAIVKSLLNKDNWAGLWNENLTSKTWNIVNGKKWFIASCHPSILCRNHKIKFGRRKKGNGT